MKRNLILVADNGNFFADHLAFEQIKIDQIVAYFKQRDIDLRIIELSEVVNCADIKNSIVFFVSSQKPYHKQYLNDFVDYLTLNDNVVIPSTNIFKAHDNKGYQELYKKILGVKSLDAQYLNKDTFQEKDLKLSFPLVYKKIDGSGSKGVQLVYNVKNLIKTINKPSYLFGVRLMIYIRELIKNKILRRNNAEKLAYFKDHENFVIQEFIPNMKFDYKVLIFDDMFYVLKRNIAKADFRASGSGLFEFVEVEHSLLDYALSLHKQFNEPYISFDICFDDKNYHLIEYQGVHFGPYTQLEAQGYYKKIDSEWTYIEEKLSFEEVLAQSLYNHVVRNY